MNSYLHKGVLPRITLLTHSPSPYQVELFDRIAGLNRIDLSVVYLYARGRDRLWCERVLAHDAKILSAQDYHSNSYVAECLRQSDLLILNYYQHRFVRSALRQTRRTGARVVFWGERPHRHLLSPLSAFFRRHCLRDVGRTRGMVWGKGTLAVEAYRREFGSSVRFENLPYFSDLERFAYPDRPLSKSSPRRFLFSGALIRRKGVDLLADAFLRLISDGKDAHIAILGAGELDAYLRERLATAGARCRFLGFADWEMLSEYYRDADVLCAPSRYDGWGLIVPEGLAAGLPVISTTTTGSAIEFVRNGRNGWLIPSDDVNALYLAMRDACDTSSIKLSEMSENAVASVEEHTLPLGAERFVTATLRALELE